MPDRIKLKRQIVAMDRGGFSEEPENPLLGDKRDIETCSLGARMSEGNSDSTQRTG